MKNGTPGDLAAPLGRLLTLARGDSGGGRRAAAFLLSLWNGSHYKADLQDVMYVDPQVFSDMVAVWSGLFLHTYQLTTVLTTEDMAPVLALWGDSLLIKRERT